MFNCRHKNSPLPLGGGIITCGGPMTACGTAGAAGWGCGTVAIAPYWGIIGCP